jgi:thiamine-phosphate pyrophosphorylase
MIKFDQFYFLSEFNQTILKKIIKYKIKNIIYYKLYSNELYDELIKIKIWCKNNRINFYIIDDYKLAVKLNCEGLYITSQIRVPLKFISYKKNFNIIGSAHNQIDYHYKRLQNCTLLFLSPIYKTNKYSLNKKLGIQRFNLMSLGWRIKTIALGGLTYNNLKSLKTTRVTGIGFRSLLNSL